MEQASNRQKWLLFSTSLLALLINVDFTAINLALPSISMAFNSQLSTIQWLMSAYMLTWSAFVVVGGRCADKYGRRKICLVGIGIFVSFSLASGCGQNVSMMIVCRLCQGVGAALIMPTLYTLIYTNFPKHRCGFAVGVICSGIGLGMAIGPSFGAFMLTHFSWRWIFWMNTPLFLLAMVILYRVATESKNKAVATTHFPSVFAIITLVISFTVLTSQISHWQWVSSSTLGLILAMIGLLGCFIFWQKTIPNPLVPLELFSGRPFLAGMTILCLQQFATTSMLFLVGFYLTVILELAPYQAGFYMMSLTAAFGLSSMLGGRLTDSFDVRLPIGLGLFLMIMGMGLFAHGSAQLIGLLVAFFVMGLGMGISYSSLNSTLLRAAPQHRVNTATGLFSMFGLLGCSLGFVLSSVLLELWTKRELATILPNSMPFALKETLFNCVKNVEQIHLQGQLSSDSCQWLLGALKGATAFVVDVNILLCIIAGLLLRFVIVPRNIEPKIDQLFQQGDQNISQFS